MDPCCRPVDPPMKPSLSTRLRAASPIFLILGLLFLLIGLFINQDIYTVVAIVLLLLSLITGGRWLRRK